MRTLFCPSGKCYRVSDIPLIPAVPLDLRALPWVCDIVLSHAHSVISANRYNCANASILSQPFLRSTQSQRPIRQRRNHAYKYIWPPVLRRIEQRKSFCRIASILSCERMIGRGTDRLTRVCRRSVPGSISQRVRRQEGDATCDCIIPTIPWQDSTFFAAGMLVPWNISSSYITLPVSFVPPHNALFKTILLMSLWQAAERHISNQVAPPLFFFAGLCNAIDLIKLLPLLSLM